MRRLVYLSKPTGTVTEASLQAILEDARANNAQHDVTGALIFQDDVFFQCLEGPQAGVQAVFDKIAHSSRHNNVQVMLDEAVDSRLFADWAMSYAAIRSGGLPGFRSLMDVFEQLTGKPSDEAAQLTRNFLLGDVQAAA